MISPLFIPCVSQRGVKPLRHQSNIFRKLAITNMQHLAWLTNISQLCSATDQFIVNLQNSYVTLTRKNITNEKIFEPTSRQPSSYLIFTEARLLCHAVSCCEVAARLYCGLTSLTPAAAPGPWRCPQWHATQTRRGLAENIHTNNADNWILKPN